ncbi:MAG: CoA transferase [Actinomycetota bacterium]
MNDTTSGTMPAMLSGMRVIEGSAFVAAPSGGMHLALLGADVIRFDPIGGGIDYTRWPLAPSGTSIYWTALNKGKRSIQLDVRSPEGRELAQALITAPGPDRGVFLTNFPARGWLHYDALRERRDDLIMLAITGNPDGTTAVDYTVNAAVGYPAATGPAGGTEPVNHVLPAWDVICGQQAALGIIAAERHRSRTGEGQLVTLALSDVAMSTAANLGHVAEAQILGEQRPRLGNELYGAFGRDFVTADGERFIVIAISPKQWTSMLAATETSEAVAALADRVGADFGDEGARFEHRQALFDLIEAWSSSHSYAHVAAALDEHGCCWGRYRDFLGMVQDDPRCSTENPMFQQVDQPGVGTVLSSDTPLRFAAAPDRPLPIAPELGAHTDEVLAEVLGMAAGEIGDLHDRGVVAGPAT